MIELPPGWAWTTLREISTLKGGLAVHANRPDLKDCVPVPYLRVANVQRGYLDLTVIKKIMATPSEIEELSLRPGDVLLNEGGDRDKLGRGWIWEGQIHPCIHQNHVFRARMGGSVLPRWVSYFANELGQAYFRKSGTQTTNLASINISKLGSLPIPVPPLAEQHRIVAEIEKQLTRVEAASDSIVGAQKRTKKYLDAVLPLFCFLPRELSHDGESTLPPDWIWARVGELGEVKLGRQRSPANHAGPNMRPYLRVANVFDDRIDTRSVHEMNFSPREYELFRLEPGDILLNEGQSLELVGRAAIYANEVPGACFQNTLVRYRPDARLRPQFALLVFRGCLRTGRFQRIAKWTTNIAHLGASRFAEMHFPLPPLHVQDQIVELAQRDLTLLSNLARQLQGAALRANRLRQAILAKAFSGQLAPQDSNDEPASALLGRVRHEQGATDQKPTRRQTPARRKTAAQA